MRLPRSALARGYALFGAFVALLVVALAVEGSVALFSGAPAVVLFLGVSTGTLVVAMVSLLRAVWSGPLRSRLLALPGLALGGLYLAMFLHGPG
jgi:hypothetical protein